MPPKKDVPGWNPVSGDEKAKGAKKSRRKAKSGTNYENSEAGPSSTVPLPSPAQTGYGPGPSLQKPPTSTGTNQTPAPIGARYTTQTPDQPAQATPSSTQPAQPLTQTGSGQAGQASGQRAQVAVSTKPTKTPGPNASASNDMNTGESFAGLAAAQMDPTGGLPNRSLAGLNNTKPGSSTVTQLRKTLPGAEGSEKKQSISDPTNADSRAESPERTHPQLQPRPGGTGTKGNPVTLSTNHFKLAIRPGLKLYRYSITVSPEAKGKKLTQMIKEALSLPEFDLLRPVIFSDFSAFLLSPQMLPGDLLKVSVPYKKGDGAKDPNDAKSSNDNEILSGAEDSSDPRKYYVRFEFIRMVDFINATNAQDSSANQGNLPIAQDLDIVLGHYRKLSPDIAMIGKRKAFPLRVPNVEPIFLSEGQREERALLAALRGFFSSVRLGTAGILVNVNVSHGPFYVPRQLPFVFRMIENRPQVHATRIPGLLKTLRVELTHLQPKKILRTISGYASPGQGNGYEAHPPRVSTFGAGPRNVEFFEYISTKPAMGLKDKEKAKDGRLTAHNLSQCGCDGSYINVYDYFKRKYPSHQVSETMPVVNVGNAQHPAYLPLSACLVIAQPSKLTLSSEETAIMQRFAVRVPCHNADSISNRGFSTLGLTNNPKLARLGIAIDPKRVVLQGRVLPQPTVMFHDKYGKDKFGEYGGSSRWNLGGMKFRSSKKLGSWACLNIHYGQRPEQKHDTCVKNFVKVLNDCGVEASGPHTTHLSASQLNQLVSIFQNYQSSKPVIRLLLVVLPNKDSQLYNQVKRLGDLKYGIQTICVVGLKNKFYNTATNDRGELRSTQYYANVALKVNIKNDGINHVLKNDQLGFISEGETMVVGIDVTHPSPGSGPVAPSVAAMVASSDKHLAQWPAEIRINPARQEQVEMLRPMLRSHLIYWKEKHGSFPEKLLIYRDGVSEGQYQMVLDEELPQLRAACELAYGDQRPPRITLIVVGKRHHTRFYRSKITGEIIRTNEGKDGNPPFGTVVDTAIVDQVRDWDFYLQSHTALHGTARPAHYFVLLDEIFKNHTPEMLQKTKCNNASDLLYSITHNMCYLFCRATTSVSIPPPVYYADIACERGRRWNSRVFDSSRSEGSGGNVLVNDDVKVHKWLTKTMFYI